MKKLLVTSFLAIILLTGCGKTQKVKCTLDQSSYGIDMNTELIVEIKGENFSKMEMVVEAELPESLLSQKEMFITSLESQYAGFEAEYGVEPKVTETDKGAKVELKMTAKQAEDFYGNVDKKVTRKEVIEEFESQGFTCT